MKLLDYNNKTTSIGKLHLLLKDYTPLFISVIPTIVMYTKEDELIYDFNTLNLILIAFYISIFTCLSFIVLIPSDNLNNNAEHMAEVLTNTFALLAQFHSIHYFMYKSDKKWQDSVSILFPSIFATIYVIFHDRFRPFLRILLTQIKAIIVFLMYIIIPYTICVVVLSIVEKRFIFVFFHD